MTSMKTYHFISGLAIVILSFISCGTNNKKADGYGNFETKVTTISAENNGKIMQFDINEGDFLQKDQYIGYIDTIPLALKREQLEVSKNVIHSKSKGVLSQINVLNAKLKTALANKCRAQNLLKDNAGTQKQLDDIQGEIDVIRTQIRSIELQNAPVVNEVKNVDIQLKQVNDQIKKSKIINPISGTVLTTYAETNEITSFGKPLYKIADLKKMTLRVYVSETQLGNLKIGEKVAIKIDDIEGMKTYEGTITWIASEAEFTPKIIQTKEERVALVYAVKIAVNNDGSLKIGMPAEMWLKN